MSFPTPSVRPVELRPFAQFFMRFTVDGEGEFDLGPTPSGHLNLGMIQGGWIEGEQLSGRVLTGMDHGVIRSDDTHVPSIGLICETTDGDRFLLSYQGMITPFSAVLATVRGEDVDPGVIDWKVMMTFHTSAPAIEWLNRVQVVARGSLVDGGIHYWAWSVH